MNNKTEIYQLKYLISPVEVYQDERLSLLQYKVVSFIYTYTGEKFFFSNKKLAKMFSANEKYISNVIKKLEEYGYVKIKYITTSVGTQKRYIKRTIQLERGDPARAEGGDPARAEHKDNIYKDIYGDDIKEIWEHYILKAKTKEELLPARKEKIRLRLKRYSVKNIKEAIDNCFNSPFHIGNNDRGWVANSDYVFKNDQVIDNLLNLRVKDNRTAEEKLVDKMNKEGLTRIIN